MTIKSNQALLNAPFGSILLTFKDGELIRCELSEAAVEEDLGSFADHKGGSGSELLFGRQYSCLRQLEAW